MRLHAPRWLRDWLILAALVLLGATIALVAMVSYSNLSDTRPLLGAFVYTLVPLFFTVGGVIFYFGLRRWARGPGKYPVLDLNEPYLRRRVQFFLAAGVVELGLLMVGGFELLEFTDNPAFCGSLCHEVMAPEYKTYQASPHARVACTDCHVGKGGSWLVKSKIQGLPLTVATVFNTYPHPITSPVESLRPARDTCEQCHWPQKFTQDRLKVSKHYLPDEQNTAQTVALAFKVGGGHADQARDIHWHIASNVWYLPLDDKRREVAWVGVKEKDGRLTEYFNPQFEDRTTPEMITEGKRRMDCVDCHNRATHIFRSPDQLVDEAMASGRIDSSLPFIKKLGLEAIEPGDSPSLAAAQSRINRIEAFYRLNYPQLAQENESSIAQALAELNRLTQFVIFPGMKVTWQTHTNFLGHDGCFRCHGELSTRPASAPRVISVGCNLCHYQVPTEVAGTAAERARPVYQLAPPPLPHKTEGWEDCLVCHGPLGFKRFTPSHVGRTNQTCLVCHQTEVKR